MSLTARQFKTRCQSCWKDFFSGSFIQSFCTDCRKKKEIEAERKRNALLIMNDTDCGFCHKPLRNHDDFNLKSCLFSLRGYVIDKTPKESSND